MWDVLVRFLGARQDKAKRVHEGRVIDPSESAALQRAPYDSYACQRVPTGTTITRASTLPSDWKSDGWGLELVEVLEQSAECDFADS